MEVPEMVTLLQQHRVKSLCRRLCLKSCRYASEIAEPRFVDKEIRVVIYVDDQTSAEKLDNSNCRDPTSTIPSTSSTSMRDTLDQLRELYHAVKKKAKNKEEEEEEVALYQEDRQPGPTHLLHTAYTGREKSEEERRQMNDIPYQ